MIKLTSEQQMLQDMLRRFVKEEIIPHAAQWDTDESFPKQTFKALGELGILGLLVPIEFGGAGRDVFTTTMVLDELSYGDAGLALSVLAHAVLCAGNLSRGVNKEQGRKYLPGLASGELIGAMGMTEPNAGSDAVGMTTTAVLQGDKWILNGTKTFITNAPDADVFMVYAKTDKTAREKGMSVFIVEKDFPGLRVGPKILKMGMRSSPTSEFYMEDCEVPKENLVGEVNQGYQHFKHGLNIERVTLSGQPVGMMRACLDIAIKYALERKQFGKPIAGFQMIKQLIVDSYAQYCAVRDVVYHAARHVVRDEHTSTMDASLAKLLSAQACTQVCLNCIQVLGGYGFTREFPVERHARDAKLLEIGAGTNEVQRLLIAKELFQAGQAI